MVWIKNDNVLFCSAFMKRSRKIYSLSQLASAAGMILALLWLTISAPFVFSYQQEIAKQNKVAKATIPSDNTEEEASGPVNGGSEEKAPTSSSNGSLSEEYLHDHHVTDHFFSFASTFHRLENAGTYIAFHGELLVPPPNAA
jgi:hypothetical protein